MLNLPDVPRRRLPNAALPLVVTQLRFDDRPQALSPDTLTAMRDAVTSGWGEPLRVRSLESGEFILRPGTPAAEVKRQGFGMSNEDASWQVSVFADFVALETTAFSEFEALEARLRPVLDAVTNHLQPVVSGRVGLRFVNLLPQVARSSGDAGPVPWTELVSSALVAPLADPELAAGVRGLDMQLSLAVDEQVSATVRCGLVRPVPSGGAGADGAAEEPLKFLLDIDASLDTGDVWDVEGLLRALVHLNGRSVALFLHLISDTMLAHLGREQA